MFYVETFAIVVDSFAMSVMFDKCNFAVSKSHVYLNATNVNKCQQKNVTNKGSFRDELRYRNIRYN